MHRRTMKSLALGWLAIILTIGAAFIPNETEAQVVYRVQYPGNLMDLSTFCVTHTQNAITPNTAGLPPGEQPPPVPGALQLEPERIKLSRYPVDDSTEVVLHAYLTFGPQANLDLYGTSAWVYVEEGSVLVVSCTGDLVIDASPGDGAASRIPAGIGATVDSSQGNGVFIALGQMTGPVVVVQYGSGASSTVALEVQSDPSAIPACGPSGCWDVSAIPVSDTDGGGCSGVRCWNW